MHERYLSTRIGNSASDDRHMYTSCDVPPELGALERVFMVVNPDQCQKLLKAGPDTDQARCTLGDADIDVRTYTQGDESEVPQEIFDECSLLGTEISPEHNITGTWALCKHAGE